MVNEGVKLHKFTVWTTLTDHSLVKGGWLGLCTLAFLLLLVFSMIGKAEAGLRSECDAYGIPSVYDLELKQAARRYFPAPYKPHWCFLKAQFWVESRLDPDARSPVGAEGIAQVMPGTASDTQRRTSIRGNVRNARTGIRVGAAYMAQKIGVWAAPRSAECRLELAWASYNAGAGNIIKAQVASGGRQCWDGIGPALHEVTGKHSSETLAYVQRIWRAIRLLTGTGI